MKTVNITFNVPDNFKVDSYRCYESCPFNKQESSEMVWCSDDEEYRLRPGYCDCVFDAGECIFKSKKVKVSGLEINKNKEKKKKSTNPKKLFGEYVFDDDEEEDYDEEVPDTDDNFKSAFESFKQAIDTTKEYKGVE